MKHLLLISTGIATLALAACKPEPKGPTNIQVPVSTTQTDIDTKMSGAPDKGMEDIGNRVDVLTAIQRNDRLAKDLEIDDARKPADVLQFSGIWPGMTVVELEAGTGYYTEILNHIVGKNGKVYMQNPPAFDGFLTPENMLPRLGQDGKRLANTEVLRAEFGKLGLLGESADMVTWFLGPHDMDHKAAPRSPETTGGDTHRIDPAHVQRRAEAAGFVLEKTSDILASKTNDYSLNVFNDKVWRKTDRFLHLYRKPK